MAKRGFTLIEVMIVIAIIGIMASWGYINFVTSQKRARDGRRKADLEKIRSDLEMCRTDTGSYPVGTLVSEDEFPCGLTTYTIPNDPLATQTYTYTGTANSYTITATLEIGGATITVTNP